MYKYLFFKNKKKVGLYERIEPGG